MPRINIIYFALFFLTAVLVPVSAQAAGASLMFSPLSESFTVGDNIQVEVRVDTDGTPVNAVQATVYFPADNLEALNISKNNAVFSLWPVEPVFDNLNGMIYFVGGLPHPGFSNGENIITIEFKVKKEGSVKLTFDKAEVLADDGEGTNILIYLQSAKYALSEEAILLQEESGVVSPQIFSPTHPKEIEWYNNNSPRFQWNLSPKVVGVSFILDQLAQTIPDAISEGLVQSRDYENIASGVWYFHLRLQDENGWKNEPAHYKIRVDDVPPQPFKVTVDNQGDSTNPKPNLYFETNDNISGISYYKLQIDQKSFVKLLLAQVNPFTLLFDSPGQHKIVVRAVDQAGNSAESKTVLDIAPIESPEITFYPKIYIAGEEVLYIEGQAPAESEITIFLEKDGKTVKEWHSLSNVQGSWSFSTKELIKSGTYELSAQAKDKRGALSYPSAGYSITVSFKGLALGPFMVSFKTLALLLFLFLSLGIIALGFFIYRVYATKKLLRKETKEAKEVLSRVFTALKQEVKEQIELFDSKAGFNEQEKKVYDDLMAALDVSEEVIRKEIHDVEKEIE